MLPLTHTLCISITNCVDGKAQFADTNNCEWMEEFVIVDVRLFIVVSLHYPPIPRASFHVVVSKTSLNFRLAKG